MQRNTALRWATPLFACVLLSARGALRAQQLVYPETRKTDHTDTYFGTTVADPYRWLEDDNSAETKAWVEAQNKLTFDYLAQIPYRSQIAARIRELVNYPRYSGASHKGDTIFFYKNSGLQNQSVLYIQKGLGGTPEVLIDPNTFSPDGTIRLTLFEPSKSGKYAVYGKTAIPGSDWQDLYVMDLETRSTLPDTIKWAKFSGASWRGEGFYYSRYPQPPAGAELTTPIANQKVYYHKLGTAQEQDELVYEDPAHPKRSVSVGTTEDEKYAILYSGDNDKRGNALFVRDETSGDKAFKPIVPDITEDSFTVLDDDHGKFLIETDRNAPNKKVMLCDPASPDQAHWQTVIAERSEPITATTAAGGRLFASYLKDVATRVDVFDYSGKQLSSVELPGPGTAGGFGGEHGDDYVFYSFTSMNYPPTIFRYDIATNRSSVFQSPTIPGFHAADYESKEVFYRSKDGTRIPMFLVYKKGLKRTGDNPTLLYGYGGFNITMNPGFSAVRLAMLEQGCVYAMACLRGGGEYGQKWHEAGMRLNKQNVFDDCIAAAEWLIKNRYTNPGKLALQGGSNGGLLVGAVINQRPDLFRVALPAVGVMDMLRFQKFTAGVAWVSDYGSSDNEQQFHYLMRYSPIQNIKEGVKYPAILVTTANHDDRVVPAHSFKYTATLQEKASKDRPALIRIETNSGHGASNLSKAIEEAADEYAFMFYNLGITPKY